MSPGSNNPNSTPPVGHRWLWVARSQLAVVGGPPVGGPIASDGPPEVCYLGSNINVSHKYMSVCNNGKTLMSYMSASMDRSGDMYGCRYGQEWRHVWV